LMVCPVPYTTIAVTRLVSTVDWDCQKTETLGEVRQEISSQNKSILQIQVDTTVHSLNLENACDVYAITMQHSAHGSVATQEICSCTKCGNYARDHGSTLDHVSKNI
jgi:hypothetical protein